MSCDLEDRFSSSLSHQSVALALVVLAETESVTSFTQGVEMGCTKGGKGKVEG